MTVPHGLRANTHTAANWSTALSILMILSGMLAIALPMVAAVAVTAIVGWLLMFSGALHLVYAWRGGHASAVTWEILLGIAYGAIGFYVIAHPLAGLAGLTLALALYLFVEGMLELVLSFQLRPAPGVGWLLVDGVITLALAAMIAAAWPSSAVWAIGTLVGISMLLSGITRLMISLQLRRLTG
jgi:uncharacterized membrane protein HdeD (DUF308 family)